MKRVYIMIIVFFFLIIGSIIVIILTNKVLEMTGGDPSEYYRNDIYSGVVKKILIENNIIIEQ